MLKIPTFVLGGLLILTGLLGYLLQDPSLSIKIKGSLADDAKLTLSDGNETQLIDLGFVSGKESAGDQAKEIITRFYGEGDSIMGAPPGPATKAAQTNNAIEHYDKGPDGIESFWFASSRGDTLEKLIQETENYINIGKPDYTNVPVDWNEVDTNSSTIKLVYLNAAGNSGPATLKVSNWKNIDMENPPKDGILEFKKSFTAFIPAIIGLVLILLVLVADAKPSARKHIMHVAVLIGLLGFVAVSLMIGPAVAEMTWLRGEPNGIIQASSLKPTTMLLSAGLLLIFVILCVVSFIQARKDMAAQAKKDSIGKKKTPKSNSKDEEEGSKKEDPAEGKSVPKSSDKKPSVKESKRPGDKSDSDKRPTESASKGLPSRKGDSSSEKESSDTKKKDFSSPKDTPDDKKLGEEKKKEVADGLRAPEKKPVEHKEDDPGKRKDSSEKADRDSASPMKKESGAGTDFSYRKHDDRKDNGPGERKDSEEGSDGDSPSPGRKEPEEAQEKKEDAPDNEPKKEQAGGSGFSGGEPDGRKNDGSGERKDSEEGSDGDSPSPGRKESEETQEKKEDAPDNEPKKEQAGGSGFSGEKTDELKDDGPGERKDSTEGPDGDSPSPGRKESEETQEK